MTVKLLTEHHLGFLGLKGGCTESSESTLVKLPHCWKSHIAAQIPLFSEFIVSESIRISEYFEQSDEFARFYYIINNKVGVCRC